MKATWAEPEIVTRKGESGCAGRHVLRHPMEEALIANFPLAEAVRPGVISFALGFGHWATGASDVEIDGEIIKGEKRRQAGLHANAAMWIDPALKNTCFLDPVGGSVSFYDTQVRLEKV